MKKKIKLSKKWDHITDEILDLIRKNNVLSDNEVEEWLSNEDNMFKCNYCKKKFPYTIMFWINGKCYCSEKCSKRGCDNLEKWQKEK